MIMNIYIVCVSVCVTGKRTMYLVEHHGQFLVPLLLLRDALLVVLYLGLHAAALLLLEAGRSEACT